MQRSIVSALAAGCISTAILVPAMEAAGDIDWVRSWMPKVGSDALSSLTAVDSDGNIYVATLADTNAVAQYDIIVLKYDASGELLWEHVYEGPGGGTDAPMDLELTDEGIALVGTSSTKSGASTVLLEYSAAGSLMREEHLLGPQFAGLFRPQLAIGSDGRRVIATDDGNGNGLVAAFDASGNALFSVPLSFEGFSGVSQLELDSANRAIVVAVDRVNGQGAYVTRQFDTDGTELWYSEEVAESGLVLSEASLVVLADDTMVVGGTIEVAGLPIAWAWGYDAFGNQEWILNLAPESFGIVTDAEAGPDGSVFVLARSNLGSFLTRVDADGNLEWLSLPDVGTAFLSLAQCAVTDSFDVICGGVERADGGTGNLNVQLLKFDSAGEQIGSELYEGDDDAEDFFGSMSIGPSGEIAVGASSIPETAPSYTATLRVDLNGQTLGDVNGDGVVDTDDLLGLLASWGACAGCDADFNGDGVVDTDDLLTLLAHWTV